MFGGSTRFNDFQRRLGLAANILATRLENFVAAGLMERRRYSEHPEHHEYLLTDKGRDFEQVIIALSAWGDTWAAPDGPPVVYEHADCGSDVQQYLRCSRCGDLSESGHVGVHPGPGRNPIHDGS